MFKKSSKTNTIKDNLRIASLLSFVAGIVNVAGFLAVERLTTNVTGHFAFFVDEIFKLNFLQGFLYLLYVFFFLLGSFISNIIIEIVSKFNDGLIYVVPVIIESLILFLVAIFGENLILKDPNLLAFSLLFAMGLQNSLVTTISNATVRTTHLTGLFTDLGIELSQLFFYKLKFQKDKLYASIKLRLTIIGFFFLGGLLSGILYSKMNLYVLLIAGIVLLIGVVCDDVKRKLIRDNKIARI